MSPSTPQPDRATRPVVTIFESYGSGADEVGPRVAEALGVAFHAQAFSSEQLEEPAERADEGLLSRVLTAMGGSYAALDGPAVAMAQRDDHELVLRNTRWVTDAARAGAVIVGRNGAMILAGWPEALHVRLDAAVPWRVGRAARAAGITPDRAARRQRREDELRADMSIRLYGWDPRVPTGYDLVLNTGTLGVDACADVIVQAGRVKARAA
ncbi:cytidylate kinase-like family protein [Jidongwangia harbinensis]|uniref:cytidylate kinase-like family protein n=1 Tax=Jidongwangia harbinensis TaxID=2878561 RepID=UPI001CD91A97|nr:cytidylate kinase-like family protein [Jidongwangia harbinensis]MCA2216678.1 cytidylate kinase-like family protein [Jidongwangia harbinensis]